MWIKTAEERSKNVFYELSQGLKVVATFGAGKVCDGAGLFPRKCMMMVFNGFIISFLKYFFRIVICPEGESKRNLFNKETNYLQIGSGRKFSSLRRE
ncbi:hypothetical protein [Bartonella sp. MF74HXZ]|uniref:hypothetical protein n=1 Tax=Bartonella sp. MF74HXZ TaxID=1461006 RepID=UPI0035CFA78A